MPDLFAEKKKDAVLSVGELSRKVAAALKGAFPARVSVRGEASNVRFYERSGILYFDLKDSDAVVKGVMFRQAAAKLAFTPADGQELVATGEVGTYARSGQYQLQTVRLEPVGEGALELARRELRAKLEAEGLTADGRKLAVPRFPRNIVIVSSPAAAGFRDMVKVLSRHRFLRTYVLPVPVQGEQAAPRITAAIDEMSRHAGRIDVVLLGRGGGAAEDLWSFNNEAVARAVAACRVPVVTGIGHQTDWTVADLVADRWCHTPTAAAEAVVEHWQGAGDAVALSSTRLNTALRRALDDARRGLREVGRHELFRRPGDLVDARRQRLDEAAGRLIGTLRDRARDAERRLRGVEARLLAKHPAATLAVARADVKRKSERLADAAGRRTGRAQDRLAGPARELPRALARRAGREGDRLDTLAARLARATPEVAPARRRVDELGETLARVAARDVADRRRRLDALADRLRVLNPTAILSRGFTLTRTADGRLVRTAADVAAGDELRTVTAAGEVTSVVSDGNG